MANKPEASETEDKDQKGFKLDLHAQILLAMFLAIIVGLNINSCSANFDTSLAFKPLYKFFAATGTCGLVEAGFLTVKNISWMGELFLRLLKMIVIPLIFCSLVNGINHMKANQLGKVGLITFIFFKTTMLIAAVIGLFWVNTINPGLGFDVGSILQDDSTKEMVSSIESHSNSNFFLEIIPTNVFHALSQENQLIQVIFFALFLGIALVVSGDKVKQVSKAFEQLFHLMLKMTHWIMVLAPYGVFGLIVGTVGSAGLAPFWSVGKYMLTVLAGILTMLLVVTPLMVFFLGKMNPLTFFRGIQDAMLTAFGTSSSAATVPVTLECVTDNLKVPESLSSFIVTIGSTMSMNGAALYESVVTLFLAQAYFSTVPEYAGLDLSLKGQIFIVAMVLLSTLGTPGIPHGGLVTTTIVLEQVGLPLHAIGLIIGVDRVLDMLRTMTNVTGDCVAALVINRFVETDEVENIEEEKPRTLQASI
ncbi:MAG TPA: dicarboxylate/amino acid:cation symporter [Vampirovibrionales bacterium]